METNIFVNITVSAEVSSPQFDQRDGGGRNTWLAPLQYNKLSYDLMSFLIIFPREYVKPMYFVK